MSKFGAVIVSYNSENELRECIESFLSQKLSNNDTFDICIVDNCSKDDSVELAKSLSKNVIVNKKNQGFAVAVNQGLKYLLDNNVDYFLILNPDAIVKPNAIKEMRKVLDSDKKIGAVGPRMVNRDGSDANAGYYLKAPSLLTVSFFSTHLRPWSLKHRWLMQRYEENLGSKVTTVHQVPGAAIFTSREKLDKIGLLCEEFAIWFEDVEWCYRARKKGYEMLFVPSAEFIHEGGVSFAKWNDLNKAVTFYVSMKTFFRIHKKLSLPFIVLVISLNSLVTYTKNRDINELRFIKRFIVQKRGRLPS